MRNRSEEISRDMIIQLRGNNELQFLWMGAGKRACGQ